MSRSCRDCAALCLGQCELGYPVAHVGWLFFMRWFPMGECVGPLSVSAFLSAMQVRVFGSLFSELMRMRHDS